MSSKDAKNIGSPYLIHSDYTFRNPNKNTHMKLVNVGSVAYIFSACKCRFQSSTYICGGTFGNVICDAAMVEFVPECNCFTSE